MLEWAVAHPPGYPEAIAFAMQVPLVVAAFLMVAPVPSALGAAVAAVQQAMLAVVVDPAVSTSKHHDLTTHHDVMEDLTML